MSITRPEDIHEQFVQRFNAGDTDAILELYEDDAAFVPAPGQVLTGKNAIREALNGFLALKGQMTMSTRYVVTAGDLALLSGEWHLRGTDPGGNPVELRGRTAEVARRQADGRWLYVADHPMGAD